jgi:DNA-binding GntR family transcriptional regulator
VTAELTIELDHDSPVPLYHQIADGLKAQIEGGGLVRGEYLPSELVLAESWRVSRPTARRALQELVDNGMLVRRRGVGTQVVASHVRRAPGLSSLYKDLIRDGHTVTTDVVAFDVVPADETVAPALEVEGGAPVIAIERIRSADGRPLALMRNWLPRSVASNLVRADLETGSLYEALRASGVRPHSGSQVIGAKVATAEEAEALGLAIGAPLLTQRRLVQDEAGRPIELGRHIYDADQYSMEFTVVSHRG